MKPGARILVMMIVLIFLSTAPGTIAGEKEGTGDPIAVIKTSAGDIEVLLFSGQAPETVANFIGLAEGKKAFTDPGTGKPVTRPFYDGLIFHRVIKDFMLQGGCPLGTGTGGPGYRFADEIDADGLGLDNQKAFDLKKGPNKLLGLRSQAQVQRYLLGPIYQKFGIRTQADLDLKKAEVEKALQALTVKEVYEAMGYTYSAKGSPYQPLRGSLAMANSGPDTNGSQFFINLVDTPWLAGKHTVFGKVVSGMEVVDRIGAVAVGQGSRPVKDVVIHSIRIHKK